MNDLTPTEKKSDILARLSKKAQGRARMSESIGHNLTKFPAAVGGLGVMAIFLFGATWPLITLASVGFGLGLGNWGFQYAIKGDSHVLNYIREVQASIAQSHQDKKRGVRPQLEECAGFNGAGDLIDRSLGQFDHVTMSFDGLLEVLERKLSVGELTFSAFAGPAEQVADSVLDNLGTVVTILKGVRSIDSLDLQRRLEGLRSIEGPSELDLEEISTLEKRLSLYREQMNRVDRILVENEKAITKIEEATAKIGDMQTHERYSDVELETAVLDLARVAERTQSYGHP